MRDFLRRTVVSIAAVLLASVATGQNNRDAGSGHLTTKSPRGVSAESRKTWMSDNGNGTFTNPIFYDEFSDPDLIRVGDDYYVTGTTMHAMPGLPVLHSISALLGFRPERSILHESGSGFAATLTANLHGSVTVSMARPFSLSENALSWHSN